MLIGVLAVSIMSVFQSYILSEKKQYILTISSLISALILFITSLIIVPTELIETLALTNSLIIVIYFSLVTFLFYKYIYSYEKKNDSPV